MHPYDIMKPVSNSDKGLINSIISIDAHIGRNRFVSRKKNLQIKNVIMHKADLTALIFTPVNKSSIIIKIIVITIEILLFFEKIEKNAYRGSIKMLKCVPDILKICDRPLF